MQNEHSYVELHGWFAYLDVFGIRALRERLGWRQVVELMEQCHDEAENRLEWPDPPAVYHAFQDSVMLHYPVDDAADDASSLALQKCIGGVKDVLAAFAEKGLPLRGGIAYGRGGLGNRRRTMLGPGPERAISYEWQVPAPLVLLLSKEYLDDTSNAAMNHIDIAFPKRRELSIRRPGGAPNERLPYYGALYYPVPFDSFLAMVKLRYEECAIKGPPEAAQGWKEAYEYITKHLSTSRRI